MGLLRYFQTDDGSLPEIVVTFEDSSLMVQAFERLFALGAESVTVGGANLWLVATQSERPFVGPDDAKLIVSGEAESLHVVLAGITCSGHTIPDLGVFVDSNCLTLDYRMGPDWASHQIESLLMLLRQIMALGGNVSVPWWGDDGERAFAKALAST